MGQPCSSGESLVQGREELPDRYAPRHEVLVVYGSHGTSWYCSSFPSGIW